MLAKTGLVFTSCGGFLPIVLLVLTLIITKYLLIKPRKENIMEANKMNKKTQLGVNAMIETGWAIGTSIAASAAPL